MYNSNAQCSGSWNVEMYHLGETAKRLDEASVKPLFNHYKAKGGERRSNYIGHDQMIIWNKSTMFLRLISYSFNWSWTCWRVNLYDCTRHWSRILTGVQIRETGSDWTINIRSRGSRYLRSSCPEIHYSTTIDLIWSNSRCTWLQHWTNN